MAKHNSLSELFTDIADSIRAKTGSTDTIVADDFPEAIEGISSGGSDELEAKVSELETWKSENEFYAEATKVRVMDRTAIPLLDTSNVINMRCMFYKCSELTTVPLFDTSNVVDMDEMFASCSELTTVPLFDTSKVTRMQSMFASCYKLTTVPLFVTSNVVAMAAMFTGCEELTTVPLFDMRKVASVNSMFSNCFKLTTVPLFDIRKVTSASGMFSSCKALTDCYLRNIKAALTVGSGTSYGHLLTVDSLVHLVYELRDAGSVKKLTVGSANLEKLANVYVRTIDITDEMRAEDDLVDEKLPFEVCESTDEGATLITQYVTAKHWTLA